MAKKEDKGTKYVSKQPDKAGFIAYTPSEHQIWAELYARQVKALPERACSAYIQALEKLALPEDKIPQLPDVSATLAKHTNWGVEGVPALISPKRFFTLLANKRFPAATFIRTREEFDYLQEPDIFHEIFGHCPLLTNKTYANFMQRYGELALEVNSKKLQWMLLRLYWFTVEFGLIQTPEEGLKVYGAGIVSSTSESAFALQSEKPDRRPFDLIQAFRTPYRIDIFQTVYYVIESFEELYNLVNENFHEAITTAEKLGSLKPTFPPKEDALASAALREWHTKTKPPR